MKPGDASPEQGLALSFRLLRQAQDKLREKSFSNSFAFRFDEKVYSCAYSVLSLCAVRKHDLSPNTLDASVASF